MAVKPNAVDIPQMMEEMAVTSVVGMTAFAGGLLFGAVVQRTHFCTMGAIADLVLFQDWRRMRAWLLAMGIAILGSQILDFLGYVELSGSLYRASDVLWLGALLGGGLFGFGMTLTGGCSSRNVVRFGAGNLKSLVVLLVMGVVGYMTMNGLLALPRLQLEAIGGIASTDQGLVSGLGLSSSPSSCWSSASRTKNSENLRETWWLVWFWAFSSLSAGWLPECWALMISSQCRSLPSPS
jgi:uncharacterized membrane protein YedE/YeeE